MLSKEPVLEAESKGRPGASCQVGWTVFTHPSTQENVQEVQMFPLLDLFLFLLILKGCLPLPDDLVWTKSIGVTVYFGPISGRVERIPGEEPRIPGWHAGAGGEGA